LQLGQKLQQSWKRGETDPLVPHSPTTSISTLQQQSVGTFNFTTVAVFALSPEIPK
jgi:hypothetical protein